jgi:acetyl esterase/lipase
MAVSQFEVQEYEVEVREVEYLKIGGASLFARVFQPQGPGPFPAVVDVHGGAWTEGDRFGNDAINMPLARRGIAVVSIDYRMPPLGVYPSSVQDVNYAVRWLKANAGRFGTTPDRVGVLGTSSGGHLAVLAALKPFDARYSALPAQGDLDARVAFCLALWPVICPYTRYRDVVLARSVDATPDRAGAGTKQMQYWGTQDAMAEGSPVLALERGDAIERPAILYIQNPTDRLHPLESAVRFAQDYRTRGGALEMHLVEGEKYNLVRTEPDSREARRALERMVAFIRAHAGATD